MKTPVCLKTAALGTVLLASAWILAGCQTTDTRTIDSKGPESLNTSAINPQDWANAADQLVQSLLSSGALATSPRQPAILAIDRVINNTSLSIDTSAWTAMARPPPPGDVRWISATTASAASRLWR